MRIYKFYLDVFFFQNFFMDGAIIILTLWVMKIPIIPRIKRIVIGDLIGTASAIFLLYLPIDYHFYELISFLVIVPLMCHFVSGIKDEREIFLEILYSYIVAFLLGGVAQVLNSRMSNFYIFSVVITFICIEVWNQIRRENNKLYICTLFYTNPKTNITNKYSLTGLLDTGNVLRYPEDNKLISITTEEIIKALGINQKPLNVQYTTVAGKAVMDVYCIDKLVIMKKGKEQVINQAYIGRIDNQILKDKKYQMILNGGVFDDEDFSDKVCNE